MREEALGQSSNDKQDRMPEFSLSIKTTLNKYIQCLHKYCGIINVRGFRG